MRSYHQWKYNEDLSGMTPAEPVASPVRQTMDQMQQGTSNQDGMGQPPAGWSYFKPTISWYTDHRGSWSDVMRVASQHPKLSQFIGTAEQAANAQKNATSYEFNFEGQRYKGMGSVGDRIEKVVTKRIPQHSKRQSNRLQGRIQPPIPQSPQQPAGETGQSTSRSTDPTITMHSGQASAQQGGSFLDYLKHLDDRLKRVENQIGVNSQA